MKITKFATIAGIAFALSQLSGCSSSTDNKTSTPTSNALSINDKAIYLRGEMNDYEASETYRLRKSKYGFCTTSTIRADWAPYKFKFADENWSKGTNFGYLKQPGVIRSGTNQIQLNPNSKFEEISFYPTKDGVYRFCLVEQNGNYYVTVNPTSKKELLTMSQVMKLTRMN